MSWLVPPTTDGTQPGAEMEVGAMDMISRPDAIVCGGGVVGAAVAYYLAEMGVRALVVESDYYARGASGLSAGIVSPPLTDDLMGPLAGLQRLSFGLHRELAETLPGESGIDYGWAVTPMLILAGDAAEERLYRSVARRLSALGEPVSWLDGAEAKEACPWLDGPVRGGMLKEHSAQVEPERFTRALLAAAERRGASKRIGRVTGLIREGGRARGVRLGAESIEAPAVVLAMGPWTADVQTWLNFRVPVEPLKGQILRMRMEGKLHWCGFMDPGGDYLMPKPSGLVYVGTTEERAGFDTSTTGEARARILEFANKYCSRVAGAEVVRQTACLRPLSADGLPIVGAVPELQGAYLATGHARSGILLATGSGKALAESIVNGAPHSADLSPFDPSRFAAGWSAATLGE